MNKDKRIAAIKAAAQREIDNNRVQTRLHGVPAQKGTPLTDMDPRNPNRPQVANDNGSGE